jgi:membrane-associated phospholipid phosphatase
VQFFIHVKRHEIPINTDYFCNMYFIQAKGFSLLQQLLHFDYEVMIYVNRIWAHPILDNIALFLRESIFHVPLYVFILIYVIQHFGKKGIWWFLGALTLVAISDLVSSHLIKDYFDRPRPCRDAYMVHQIRFLAKYCGSNGSFTSSHAVNHFAFAAYAYFTLGKSIKWFKYLFLWAAAIAYSQVYVGVHFPSDVVFGAVLGLLFGYGAARIANQTLSLHQPSI